MFLIGVLLGEQCCDVPNDRAQLIIVNPLSFDLGGTNDMHQNT